MKSKQKIFICASSEKKRGRPPLFGKAMTRAESAARWRAKKKVSQSQSLVRSFPDLKSARHVPGPLTSQIKSPISFVRRFIDTHFSDLRVISAACNRDLKQRGFSKHKSESAEWIQSIVGTATDYRIRAYFDRNIHKSSVVRGGLEKLTIVKKVGAIENVWYRERSEQLARKFTKSFEEFIDKIKPERRKLASASEEELCRFCVMFAYLDHLNRSPFYNFPLLEQIISWGDLRFPEMLTRFEHSAVVDVIALSNRFYASHKVTLRSFENVILGRSLAGSKDVGRADFDIVVDGCLIDFKCTATPKITTTDLRQLIGYWLLDYNDSLRIRSVAVNLLRHDCAHKYDIRRDLLSSKISMAAIRQDFRKGLRRISSI